MDAQEAPVPSESQDAQDAQHDGLPDAKDGSVAQYSSDSLAVDAQCASVSSDASDALDAQCASVSSDALDAQ